MPLPPDRLEDTIEAHLNRVARPTSALYVSILLVIAAALASLPFVRVEVSLQARGIIRPTVDKHAIVAPVGGFVDSVFVRDQQIVQEGEPVLALDPAPATERKRLLDARREELELAIADLESLLRWLDDPGGVPAIRSPAARAEYRSFAAAIAEADFRVDEAADEARYALRLVGAGLLPPIDEERHLAAADRAVLAKNALLEGYRATWQRQVLDHTSERDRLLELNLQLETELANLTIRAPRAGTLEKTLDVSRGSFIRAGDEVARISPHAPLIAEVFVPASEFGLLDAGMPARILIDALNYQDWGVLSGRILTLPQDFSASADQAVFRTIVELDDDRLRLPNGATRQITKGMPVQARFPVAERSLWHLLRDDLNDWFNPRQYTSSSN